MKIMMTFALTQFDWGIYWKNNLKQCAIIRALIDFNVYRSCLHTHIYFLDDDDCYLIESFLSLRSHTVLFHI